MPDFLDHTVLSERHHVEHNKFVAFALESILDTRPDANQLAVSGGAEVPH